MNNRTSSRFSKNITGQFLAEQEKLHIVFAKIQCTMFKKLSILSRMTVTEWYKMN